MRHSDQLKALELAVQSRFGELQTRPYFELLRLPNYFGEELSGTKVTIGTYREIVGESSLQIIVQGYLPGWFGMVASICVYGFETDSKNTVRLLPENALWDYT